MGHGLDSLTYYFVAAIGAATGSVASEPVAWPGRLGPGLPDVAFELPSLAAGGARSSTPQPPQGRRAGADGPTGPGVSGAGCRYSPLRLRRRVCPSPFDSDCAGSGAGGASSSTLVGMGCREGAYDGRRGLEGRGGTGLSAATSAAMLQRNRLGCVDAVRCALARGGEALASAEIIAENQMSLIMTAIVTDSGILHHDLETEPRSARR